MVWWQGVLYVLAAAFVGVVVCLFILWSYVSGFYRSFRRYVPPSEVSTDEVVRMALKSWFGGKWRG